MATAKKTVKKSSSAKSKQAPMRSFQPSPEQTPFFHFRITQQTAYWLILCLLILALGVWVITLSVKVQTLYDEIEATTTQQDVDPSPKKSSY